MAPALRKTLGGFIVIIRGNRPFDRGGGGSMSRRNATLPTPVSAPGRPGSCAAANCAACEVRSLTFCIGLEHDEIRRLSAIVTRLGLAAHQMLFHEGDAADFVYNVTRGVMKLYKLLPDGRRQITGFLLPGDFLGLAGKDGYS